MLKNQIIGIKASAPEGKSPPEADSIRHSPRCLTASAPGSSAEIFPMLPEKLSTNLTSLGESQERLAIVIDMTVAADGTVGAGDIYRAVVLNRAKLAYNSVAAWLEGTGPAPAGLATVKGLDEQLRVQDRVAQAMRGQRHAHGALRLETVEARPVYEDDVLIDMRPDQRNRAKDLIEDFMIAANGVSARFLENKGYPSLRRVLRTPKRWDRIVELASAQGERLPTAPSAQALDAFLESRRQADPERFPDLSLTVVKLLGSGEYALELPGQDIEGHFGLAVRDYTHSTAPNRRFPDLIAQRLLKAALAGRRPLYQRRAHDPCWPLHDAGGQRHKGRAPGAQVRGRDAADLAHRRALRRNRDGRVGKRHLGPRIRPDGRRAGSPRLRGSRCRRPRPRGTHSHRRCARLHRLRESAG